MRLLFLALCLSIAGCHDAPGAGDRCIANSDCDDGLLCYSVTEFGSRRCLAPCDPAQVVLCTEQVEGTEGLCAALDTAEPATPPTEAGACLVGGEVPLGAACVASIDCLPGGVCLAEDGVGACRQACDVTAGISTCDMGMACVAIDEAVSADRGQCVKAQEQPDAGS
jgi:hypothetical protein